MDLGLQGWRALVTGASGGIGAAVARCFASEGCALLLSAHDMEGLEAVRRDIAGDYPDVAVELIEIDLRQPDAVASLAAAARDVDILVNVAGDVPSGRLLEIDEQRWRKAWDLKIFGYINLSRELYRPMISRGRGVIINVVGAAGERPRGENIAVSSGNAALLAFSRALGTESVSHGIRCLAVNPGATETERQVHRLKGKAAAEFGDESRWREYVAQYPFGRLARPDEIASVIVFLASGKAGYVSGTAITVDGGHVA